MTKVLISGERLEYGPKENSKRSKALETYLETLGFNVVKAFGKYKGKSEISFLVEFESDEVLNLEKLASVARVFDQESILKITDTVGVILDTDLKPVSESLDLRVSLERDRPKQDHTAFFKGSEFEVWTFNVTK